MKPATLKTILRRILFGVVVVALCSVTYVARQIHDHQSNHRRPIVVQAVVPPSLTDVLKSGTSVLNTHGSGTDKTSTFTAKANWGVHYSFDCGEDAVGSSFAAYVYNPGASKPLSTIVNASKDESGVGSRQISAPGSYYISVAATPTCTWQITVKDPR